MNGTIQRWLRGMVLALGAALVFTSVGCVEPSDESESDGDGDVSSADQELDPVDGEDDDGEAGNIVLPGSDVALAEDRKGPEPQPWRHVEDDSGADPGPDPYSMSHSSTPGNGHD